jgi:hypothetical protein
MLEPMVLKPVLNGRWFLSLGQWRRKAYKEENLSQDCITLLVPIDGLDKFK